ncbi:MAG: alpha/beta hydrolase [Thermoguttaceae bacterium]|nr:alpha/beta hydrolase [Thermoguttaceae bacterium]MBR4752740.1 alpha/beta hydrolase [Thermoguttaceae bacterium]
MKRTITLAALALTVAAAFLCGASASAFDEYNVWPGVAPGEKEDATKPTYEYWKPENKTSDSLMIVCPGGAYNGLAYGHEGGVIAQYFNSKGITAVVLKYRVPRREGIPKHMAAWQDAQRCVRVVRSRAEEWGIDPNKIGILGFSAGGHLTLMTATTSQTNSYEPVDEIDKLPCNVNFAVPVYPAYVLEDGVDGYNTNKGADSPMVGDFAFDEKTPPMCMIHGDADGVSPMGSVAVYAKLRKMNIPAEMHIYATIEHGFGGNPKDDHVGDWLNRVYAWMKVVGF